MRKIKDLSVKEKKEFLRDLVQSWGKDSSEEIAKRWDLAKQRVTSMASYIRRKGVDLPKVKSSSKFLTPEFIEELNTLAKRKYKRERIQPQEQQE